MEIKIDKIIPSKRKSIALQITEDASLIVRIPYNMKYETMMEFVNKNKSWIVKKKNQIEQRITNIPHKEFIDDEIFPYLGNYYKLKTVDNQKEQLKFDNAFYLSNDTIPKSKIVFIKWYKEKAFEIISERVNYFAKQNGFRFNKIKINSAEKRWGSCSSKGNLNFSWRLIMTPLSVIDYVIIHELVHLEIKNHSKIFWNKVKLLMPDYKRYEKWLKDNNHLLKF